MRQVPNNRAELAAIYGVVSLAEWAHNIFLPLLTILFFLPNSAFFVDDVSIAQRGVYLGIAIALMRAGGIIAHLFLGMLADRFSAIVSMRISLFGLMIMISSITLAWHYSSLSLLLIGLFLGSALYALRSLAATAISAITPSATRCRYLSWLQTAIAFGAMTGPLILAYFAESDGDITAAYQSLLLVMMMVIFLSFAVSFIIRKHRVIVADENSEHQLGWAIFKCFFADKHIRGLIILLIVFQFSWASYFEFIPAIVTVMYAKSASEMSLFVAALAGYLVFTSTLLIPWLRHYYRRLTLLHWGSYLMVFGLLASLLASIYVQNSFSFILLCIAAIAVAVGDMMVFVMLLSRISELVDASQRGHLMGLLYMVVALVWVSSALLGGYLMATKTNAVLLFAPIGCIIALFSLQWHKIRGYTHDSLLGHR